MIPYSIAEIVNEKIHKDPHDILNAWGYSDMDIAKYEAWREKKVNR